MKDDKAPTTRHLFVGGAFHGQYRPMRRMTAGPGVDPLDASTLPKVYRDITSNAVWSADESVLTLPDPLTGKPKDRIAMTVYVLQTLAPEHRNAAVADAAAQAFFREFGGPGTQPADSQDNGHERRDWWVAVCHDCTGGAARVLSPTELGAKQQAAQHAAAMGHYVTTEPAASAADTKGADE